MEDIFSMFIMLVPIIILITYFAIKSVSPPTVIVPPDSIPEDEKTESFKMLEGTWRNPWNRRYNRFAPNRRPRSYSSYPYYYSYYPLDSYSYPYDWSGLGFYG
jgi:hypothetical protein